MNYVQIAGGIGNQLFQYSFSKYLEKITNKKTVLDISFYKNTRGMPNVTTRDFVLDKFKLDLICVEGSITCSNVVNEYDDFKIDLSQDHVYYSGYWQNLKYCGEILDEIRNKFDLMIPDKNVQSILNERNAISIHVRRGDYLNQNNSELFVDLGQDYYDAAISKMIELLGKDVSFYVFSDDLDYCKSEFKELAKYETVFVPTGRDYEDLFLMSKTKHHIIANSTFSWWGAVLSDGGITIAPSKWYKHRDAPNLYIKTWNII